MQLAPHISTLLPTIGALLRRGEKMRKKSCCYGNMLPFHEQTDFEFMPQISRYSDQQVEQLLSELTNVLESHKAPVDLSLMVLGNMVTNLINSSVAPAQRQAIARSFAQALQSSINDDPAH